MKCFAGILVMMWGICKACKLSEVTDGQCVESGNLTLGFCGGKVYEYMCIPFNYSEWNWTVYDKEVEVRNVFIMEMEKILALEVKGVGGEFSKNVECTNTLKSIICQMNFPYCVNDTSYGVCGKGCEYLKSMCLTTIDYCTLNEDIVGNSSNCTSGSRFLAGLIMLSLIFI